MNGDHRWNLQPVRCTTVCEMSDGSVYVAEVIGPRMIFEQQLVWRDEYSDWLFVLREPVIEEVVVTVTGQDYRGLYVADLAEWLRNRQPPAGTAELVEPRDSITPPPPTALPPGEPPR